MVLPMERILPNDFPFQPETLYCVAGWPLSQSLSPLLHNMGFQCLRLPAVYLRFAVEPARLGDFVRSVRLLHMGGCSVTIPHKAAVIPLLDGVSEQAAAVGAVNTLYWKDGQLRGENTDITGFMAPLASRFLAGAHALLLGAGGAAAAAVAGLQKLGCARICVATPSDRRHLALAERLGCVPVNWEDRYGIAANIIVNATPLGMRGALVNETPYDFARAKALPPGACAYDIVYNPPQTRFLREAAAAGLACVTGREMFFAQGDAQFLLWTGRHLPREARGALDAALNAVA